MFSGGIGSDLWQTDENQKKIYTYKQPIYKQPVRG